MKGGRTNAVSRSLHGLCRLILGVIFIYAASRKLAAPQDFADSIATYRLVPELLIGPIALGLPLFELACGLFLLTGFCCATGLLSTIGVLILFMAAMLIAVARGLPIECGCFGAESWLDANPWMVFARDGLLLAGAVAAYRHRLALKLELEARRNGDARS